MARKGAAAVGALAVIAVAALLIRGLSRSTDAPNREIKGTVAAVPKGPPSTSDQPARTDSPLGPPSTQGQLATTLASRTGLGDNLTEDRAIGLLASRGIAPDAGWEKGGPATEAVIAQIQKTFHVLLTDVANDLKIQVPATLNLFIFQRGQTGGQVYHVGPRDMSALRASGGVVRPDMLKAAETARVSIDAPYPYPIGDDRLPAVWSYRLRQPGASFIRVHFEKLDLGAPSHLRILDRYGQEIWQYIGGDPRHADVWASAVDGDTAIVVLHAGAVASGTGLRIDSYSYGASTSVPTR